VKTEFKNSFPFILKKSRKFVHPGSIVGITRIFDLHEVPPSVSFQPTEVGKSTKPADFHSKSVGFLFASVG
jgi:hypothetical protein